MANFTALKTAIQNAIRQNGNEEITGDVLQQILLSVVNTMGEGAINTIEQNLSNETLARQNADTTLQSNINAEKTAREGADNTLQSNINAEALARGNADTQLQNAINSEETARGNADTVLQGNIEIERNTRIAADNTLDGKIATEKNQRIAAVDSLNAAINAINDSVKNGYVYAGIAQPSSAPMTGKVFYIATKAGQYVNFSNIQVPAGINILKKVGSTWVSEFVFNSDALMAEIVSFEEQVRTLLEDYQPIIINGDVVNAPDEVDITAQPDGLLKFKDKVYDPLVFSGMGRKYLRKNIRPEVDSVDFDGFVEDVPTEDSLTGTPDSIWWDRINEEFVGKKDDVYYLAWTDDDSFVPASTELIYMYDGNPYRWNGTEFYVDEDVVPTLKNILTQAMISQPNTIYVIQYDFDLDGNSVTIPENCVLEFGGGSISGAHTLTGSNTGINAGLVKIFNTDVTLAGNWNVTESYLEWFGANGDGIDDESDCFTAALQLSNKVFISAGIHNIDKEITTVKPTEIYGIGDTSVLFKNSVEDSHIMIHGTAPLLVHDVCFRSVNDQWPRVYRDAGKETEFKCSNVSAIHGINTSVAIENCLFECVEVFRQNGGQGIVRNNRALYTPNFIFANGGDGELQTLYIENNKVLMLGIYLYYHFLYSYLGTKTYSRNNYITSAGPLCDVYHLTRAGITHEQPYQYLYVDGDYIECETANLMQNVRSYTEIRNTTVKQHWSRTDLRSHSNIQPGTGLFDSTVSFFNCDLTWDFYGSDLEGDYTFEECKIHAKTEPGGGTSTIGTVGTIFRNCLITAEKSRLFWYSGEAYNTIFKGGEIIRTYQGSDAEAYSVKIYNCVFTSLTGQNTVIKHNDTNKPITVECVGNTFVGYTEILPADGENVSKIIQDNNIVGAKKIGLYSERPSARYRTEGLIFVSTDYRTGMMMREDGSYIGLDGYPVYRKNGNTSERPTLTAEDIGCRYFDTTLNKPIWWTGTAWVDATGATV